MIGMARVPAVTGMRALRAVIDVIGRGSDALVVHDDLRVGLTLLPEQRGSEARRPGSCRCGHGRPLASWFARSMTDGRLSTGGKSGVAGPAPGRADAAVVARRRKRVKRPAASLAGHSTATYGPLRMADATDTGPQSDRVLQATGMASVQARCTLPEAFDLLRERAFALDQTLEFTAIDVVNRVIRFD